MMPTYTRGLFFGLACNYASKSSLSRHIFLASCSLQKTSTERKQLPQLLLIRTRRCCSAIPTLEGGEDKEKCFFFLFLFHFSDDEAYGGDALSGWRDALSGLVCISLPFLPPERWFRLGRRSQLMEIPFASINWHDFLSLRSKLGRRPSPEQCIIRMRKFSLSRSRPTVVAKPRRICSHLRIERQEKSCAAKKKSNENWEVSPRHKTNISRTEQSQPAAHTGEFLSARRARRRPRSWLFGIGVRGGKGEERRKEKKRNEWWRKWNRKELNSSAMWLVTSKNKTFWEKTQNVMKEAREASRAKKKLGGGWARSKKNFFFGL